MSVDSVEELEHVLDRDLAIAIRRGPSVPGVVRRAIKEGRLTAVLPGIYARTESAKEPLVRMAALQIRDPDTVFTGLSAAGLLWDPRLLPAEVTATGRLRSRHRGFALSRRSVDPDSIVVVNGLRCTSPELTALDLIPGHGADYVDQLLRKARKEGRRLLKRLWRVLEATRSRAGNKTRRAVLVESRDIPWSAAERLAHRLLREAGITGWVTNLAVRSRGSDYSIDIAFPRLGIAIEIDGREFHTSRDAFERDRRKQNDLVADGWKVLRFTWAMLHERGCLTVLRDLARLSGCSAPRFGWV